MSMPERGQCVCMGEAEGRVASSSEGSLWIAARNSEYVHLNGNGKLTLNSPMVICFEYLRKLVEVNVESSKSKSCGWMKKPDYQTIGPPGCFGSIMRREWESRSSLDSVVVMLSQEYGIPSIVYLLSRRYERTECAAFTKTFRACVCTSRIFLAALPYRVMHQKRQC